MPELTPDDVRKAAVADYATYVAKDAILIQGVRAFNAGDPVPASHVEANIVSADAVVKTTTKAGQALITATEV